MKKFHIKRLYKLADYLYNQVEPKDFLFTHWVHPDCGSPGCGIGHACVLFRKQGFKMEARTPTYQGFSGFRAVGKFFGLLDEYGFVGKDVLYLFSPHGAGSKLGDKATPKQVANQIRRFCKKMEKKS
jgi:hypothetical protein